jgi:hypothetical protein
MSCRPRHFWDAGTLEPWLQLWVQYPLPSKPAQMPPGGQSASPLQVLVHSPPCGEAPLMPRLPVSRQVSGPQAASEVHARPSCAAPGTGPPLELEEADELLLDALVELLLLEVEPLLLDEVLAPPAPPAPPAPGLVGAAQAINRLGAAARRRRVDSRFTVRMCRTLSDLAHARKPMVRAEFV